MNTASTAPAKPMQAPRNRDASKAMQREALDKLVHRAYTDAKQDPLWTAELPDLEAAYQNHKTGTNHLGWKNPYPTDDPRHLLFQYQFALFHDRARFKASLMARQTGKDFTGQGEVAEDCLHTPKTEWMVAAPSERQALDSLEKCKEWSTAFGLVISDYNEERAAAGAILKSAEVTFSNGSRSRAVPGRPDTVRGRSTNVFLTEFDFFDDPASTWRAILPSITNPLRGGEKKVRVLTTPNGSGGAMHRIWTKDDSTSKIRWSRHLVTIYHAALMGLPVDVDALKDALDDPDGFDQEFLCRFLDGNSVLLPYDIIALAESFDATEFADPALFQSPGKGDPLFCGIDFGRQNDPTVCWTLQLTGGILWTREVLVIHRTSTPDQEQLLRHRIAASQRTSYDYTGPGIGLGDYLVSGRGRDHGLGQWKPEAHSFGKLELCTFTVALKRDIFPKLRRAFEAPTKVRIPISVAIREDLHSIRQVIKNGQYSYDSPRTKEGHSDRATALALALRAASTHAGPFHYTPARALLRDNPRRTHVLTL